MTQWIKYFLVGIAETAQEATDTLSKILEIKAKLEHKINGEFGRKSNSASKLLNYLFQHPIVDVREVQQNIKLSYKAANDLVNDFIKAGILIETTGQSRNRLFTFEEYVELFIKLR
jgi:Fic family protein